MKPLFYLSILLFCIFEVLNVYFIMPMPGSQEGDTVAIAYFLYSYRWVFRIALSLIIAFSFYKTWNTRRKGMRIATLVPLAGIIWMFNFKMTADRMFLQPSQLIMVAASENQVSPERIVIGISSDNMAKAYPVEFLTYHHQVRDQIGGKEVMVTYCSVCRTGRVFEPVVNSKSEIFRLVGMDHFNAMFEDRSTGSWWRQATGEAVTGSLKGEKLPEVFSQQMKLSEWLRLYPHSLIMQPDPASLSEYDLEGKYELGLSKGSLTGTNPASWQAKSWVIGIREGDSAKVYDWNELEEKRILNDKLSGKTLFIALALDGHSFAAYQNPSATAAVLNGDTIVIDSLKFDFGGKELSGAGIQLKPVQAYQEFWHSWEQFQPGTALNK